MDPALADQPIGGLATPPPPDARPPARLYLPGNECLFRAVTTGGNVIGTVPPAARRRPRGAARRGAARRTGRLRLPGPGATGPDRPTSCRAAGRRGPADRHRAGARLARHHAVA